MSPSTEAKCSNAWYYGWHLTQTTTVPILSYFVCIQASLTWALIPNTGDDKRGLIWTRSPCSCSLMPQPIVASMLLWLVKSFCLLCMRKAGRSTERTIGFTSHELTFSNDSWAESKEKNHFIKSLHFGVSKNGRKDLEVEHNIFLQLQENSTGLDIFHHLVGKDRILSALHFEDTPIKDWYICFNKIKCKSLLVATPFNTINQNYTLNLHRLCRDFFPLSSHVKLNGPSQWKISAIHLFKETFLILNNKLLKWLKYQWLNISNDLKYQQILCFNQKDRVLFEFIPIAALYWAGCETQYCFTVNNSRRNNVFA